MSDHVVVKRELLETLSRAAESGALFSINHSQGYRQASVDAKAILAQQSPEMVPMAEVKSLLNALTTIANIRSGDHRGYVASTTATAAIHAFNAKFKPTINQIES